MLPGLETRVGQLEDLHDGFHRCPHTFDGVTLVTCDLAQILSSCKIVNMVGQIDSRSSSTSNPAGASDTHDCTSHAAKQGL